jgi:LCP family protein required for cell wall assembly
MSNHPNQAKQHKPAAQTQTQSTYPHIDPGRDPRLNQLYGQPPIDQPPKANRMPLGATCGCLSLILVAVFLITGLYFVVPGKTRILLLGIDRAPNGTAVSRTDTIILTQIDPPAANVRLLSIPRDLWVPIPEAGENRINTAHFFAEAAQSGSGPQAVIDTVDQNFGIRAQYYARIQFDGFQEVIDALGGLDLNLEKPMGGLHAGKHHLSGVEALAFARDRKGTDDFFRMNQGQMVIKATISQILFPSSWVHFPALINTLQRVITTNVPLWLWPRIGFTMIRAINSGFDQQTLSREMAVPFTTSGGAQVLQPNWELINPLVESMFNK